MNRNAALALCVLFALGCGKSKQQQAPAGAKDGGDAVSSDAAGAPPADAAPSPDAAEAAADAAAAPPASGIEGREDGVGPLNDDFEVTRESLAKAFPGVTVKHVKKSQGGDLVEEYWAVWGKDGKEMLHIQAEDEDLEAVDIVSNDVSNPLGVKIGATYEEVVKAIGPLHCSNAGDETDWRADTVVCSSDKSNAYTIDFISPDADDAAAMLEDPAKLAKATVEAVTWRAPMPGPGVP
jgi:hypothetical protein